MKIAVHQPQYLPWLGYFHKVKQADLFVLQDDVQYKHREFQNRNKIKTVTSSMWLTIPIVLKGKRNQLINQCRVNNEHNWQEQHWKSILFNYHKAPFFEQYSEFLQEFYTANNDKLSDINIQFIKFALSELRIDTPLLLQSTMNIGSQVAEERIVNICKQVGAGTYLSGVGGREWMDLTIFKAAGIQVEFQTFEHPEYKQLHHNFIPNLSVLDLLLNIGTKSSGLL